MDNKLGSWVVAEMNDGFSELLLFTGTPDLKKAITMMKKKYGKFGHFNESSGEIEIGDDLSGHYYTLLWLPIDLRIAFWVGIQENSFQVGTNLLGADLKLYYLDVEHSKIIKVKPFKLTDEAISDMEQDIKEQKKYGTR